MKNQKFRTLFIQLNTYHLKFKLCFHDDLVAYNEYPIFSLGGMYYIIYHTSQNSFYKWTKISCLEIDIFDLKMMMKSGLDFFDF